MSYLVVVCGLVLSISLFRVHAGLNLHHIKPYAVYERNTIMKVSKSLEK